MLKGNKGEWSEVYVLLHLLATGKIHSANEKLECLKNIYFPIVGIVRREDNITREYVIKDTIEVYIDGELVDKIHKKEFIDEAEYLLGVLSGKTATSFSVERTEKFLNRLHCHRLSAPSTNKSDITLKILDIQTGYSPTVGFSIKSELGSAPTLLNAGKTTNFIYEINHNIDDIQSDINFIFKSSNGIDHVDVRGRINRILEDGGKLDYHRMANPIFADNLELIDSNMDQIIAKTLLYFYCDGITSCEDLVTKLEQENPMKYGNIKSYQYKFKKFLTAVALGMKPATPWDGIDEATGGYIIVTKTGDVLAYHIYNRNYFEEYLLSSTKYETASTSRHGFGEVYEDEDMDCINLNLQIRFK